MKKLVIKLLLITVTILSFGYIEQTNATKIKVNTLIDLSPMVNECHWWDEPYCEFDTWVQAIVKLLGWIIKYFTFIVWLLAVLFIIVNWIMYSMRWVDQTLKDEAKKRIKKTLFWIIILLMSWVILNFIAPWVYTL